MRGDEILIRPKSVEGPKSARLVCMVSQSLGIAEERRSLTLGEGAFHRPKRDHSGVTLRYLLGWQSPEFFLPVFEPWAEAGVN